MASNIPGTNIFEGKIPGAVNPDNPPQFAKLLKKLQIGDELVVMKLDRLGGPPSTF